MAQFPSSFAGPGACGTGTHFHKFTLLLAKYICLML